MEPVIFSISAFCEFMNKDRRTVTRIVVDAKLKPHSQDNKTTYYYLKDLVTAIYGSSKLDLTAERAKLTQAQEEKTRLDVERMQGMLVEVDAVESDASKTGETIKNGMLMIPARISSMLANETDARKIEQMLDGSIRDVLNELSSSIFINEETDAEEDVE